MLAQIQKLRTKGEDSYMKSQKISIDLRIVILVLAGIIAAMLIVWRPWNSSGVERTIDITGEATSEEAPDEYQFMPEYQKKGTDRAVIQAELATQINTVLAELKTLGVRESDITLQSSTYDNYWNDGTQEITSNSLTIKVADKDLAQKVQDYLATTSPYGQITPYAMFSDAKRKNVETLTRSKALADAKAKAEQTATELGLKVGKVVRISDPQNGVVMPYFAKSSERALGAADAATVSSLPVLSGTQDITYTVQVTYELR
jgi:uncharacterized protein